MQLPTAITILSSLALLSSGVLADNTMTFDTWTDTSCNLDSSKRTYKELPENKCFKFSNDPKSLRVYYARSPACKINTFSNDNCTGTTASYQFVSYQAPCTPISGKKSFRINC